MSQKIFLLDDSGATGGAQNLLARMNEALNVLGYECSIHTTEEVLTFDTKDALIINGTDWKSAGFVHAEELSKKGKLWLLSQINPFVGFVRLYVDWESHLFNRIRKARNYYAGVITLNEAHDVVWRQLGWTTIKALDLTHMVSMPSNPSKIIIAANHWDYNRDYHRTLEYAQIIAKGFDNCDIKIVSRSSDTTPLKLEEFGPDTIYVHWSHDDVSPLLIQEALSRGSFVVTNHFPGAYSASNDYNRFACIDNLTIETARNIAIQFRGANNWNRFIHFLNARRRDRSESADAIEATWSKVLGAAMDSWQPTWEEVGYNAPTKKSKTGGKK